jgi:nucleoid-associated protein YgaU
MARVATSDGTTLWYMDSLGRLYYRALADASAAWQMAGNPNDKVVDFAVLPNGQVYGINGEGQFFTLGADKKWGSPHATIKQVESLAADASGTLWIVNFQGAIYRLPQGGSVEEGPAQPSGNVWTYTVKPNDTLAKIVRAEYRVPEPLVWGLVNQIFNLNRDKISNPDVIQPGWVLNMPPR